MASPTRAHLRGARCGQNRIKVRRRCGMKCWRNVTVDIERSPDRAVTQHLLDHLWVNAGGQEDRRIRVAQVVHPDRWESGDRQCAVKPDQDTRARSEEHTSELQSRQYLVCR